MSLHKCTANDSLRETKSMYVYNRYLEKLLLYQIRRLRPLTQCTDIQKAIAFALIRLGNISGSKRPGTGPAPTANIKTNLHNSNSLFNYNLTHLQISLPLKKGSGRRYYVSPLPIILFYWSKFSVDFT